MTRVLIVKPILPYPPDQGTKVVTLNLLRILSRHFEVSLLCGLLNREDESQKDGLKPYCRDIFTFLLPNRKTLLHAAYYKAAYVLKSSLTGFPLEAYYCSPPLLSRRVAEVTRANDYDIAQFEYWFTANAARFAEVTCKVLLEHDVDFLRYQRRLFLPDDLRGRHAVERSLTAVRRREILAFSEFDKVLALSRTDSLLIEKLAGIKGISEHLPVIVDCERYVPFTESKIPSSVVFLGALDADFNIDALEYFVKRIFPLVLSEVPETRLFIVGRRPPGSIERLADGQRIVLHANVEDIRPYIRSCAVQVVPLRFGGGVRIRTLEGMAMGMAIVSTTVGMDGIDAVAGRDFLLGDNPEDFALRVCEMLRNPILARRLGERAREFVEAEHSEAALEQRIVDVFRRLKELADEKRLYIRKRGQSAATEQP